MNYDVPLGEIFGAPVLDAATQHAIACFPRESCGFVAGNEYVACDNKAQNANEHFVIEDARYDAAVLAHRVQAIIHSHPNGPIFPSEADMRQQIATAVPWIIVPVFENQVHRLVAWGDTLPIAPIIGRPFVHGIFDCYSCIRDAYRLGGDLLAKEGIEWPFAPILLPEVPRNDDWWQDDQDLYVDHFKPFGFHEVKREETRPGDIFLMRLGDSRGNPKQKINHGGLVLPANLLLHHLPNRCARREPSAIWLRAADLWIRHESANA